LLINAPNNLIIGKSHSIALELFKMHDPKSLTLCWCSVDARLMFIFRMGLLTHRFQCCL
jgi:hypothetical protein